MYEATTPLAARTATTMAVDNLLRRELRVGNPADPDQIAQGLLTRYPILADQMKREREGYNYSNNVLVSTVAVAPTSSSLELAQAQNDLERDAQSLISSSELKDIQIELTGWTRAVREAATQGIAAAGMALDIVQHDQAMAARRTLGDYARLARYVGAGSADTGPLFRRFAQSCDVLAALILVAIGDGMAANGVTRGTALIRVSASELQARRDAVISALRSLVGSGSVALGQNDYPRGLVAYRMLVNQLETAGQSDLRTLLNESSMSLELDRLVDLAAGASPSALRELSTTSAIVVDRLTRLVSYCQTVAVNVDEDDYNGGSPESPPMTFFAAAVQMFLDSFINAGGTRLLFIARPAIISYGLYGLAGPDDTAYRLISLTMWRNRMAELIDCQIACGCDPASMGTAVILDYLLYRLDRAIDLFAVSASADGRGEPEIRACVLYFMIKAAVSISALTDNSGRPLLRPIPDPDGGVFFKLRELLLPSLPDTTNKAGQIALTKELNGAYLAEEMVERLVRTLSPACLAGGFLSFGPNQRSIVRELIATALYLATGDTPAERGEINIPQDPDASLAMIAANRSKFRHG